MFLNNVRELSLRLTRLLCQFVNAKSASIFILDPSKKKIMFIAIYNNKINILLTKKKDMEKINKKEKKVTEGYSIFEKYFVGLPLVTDDILGAVFVRRARGSMPFSQFDKEILAVFIEQSVTAIKNLQLYEQQQKIILSSMKFIDKLLKKQSHSLPKHTPVYFNIMKCLAEVLHIGQYGIDCLYHASVLHDAGALDIPYEILSKTSQLTPEEFKIIRDLPGKSVQLIRPVEFLRPVLPIILYHREKYDGSGYPSGLKKEQIPIGARIMAVVDAFEAMIKGRPYKDKLTIDAALNELRCKSGTQFDPKVVNAFCDLFKQKKFRNYLRKIG